LHCFIIPALVADTAMRVEKAEAAACDQLNATGGR
jgi:hypothetical protein